MIVWSFDSVVPFPLHGHFIDLRTLLGAVYLFSGILCEASLSFAVTVRFIRVELETDSLRSLLLALTVLKNDGMALCLGQCRTVLPVICNSNRIDHSHQICHFDLGAVNCFTGSSALSALILQNRIFASLGFRNLCWLRIRPHGRAI